MKLRNMLAAASLALTAVGQAFAGYVGPDNVTYQYKVVNWYIKEINDPESDYISATTGWVSTTVRTDHHEISGAATYGPSGLEDYSATQSWKLINRITNSSCSSYAWDSWEEGYSPEESWAYASSFYRNSCNPSYNWTDPGYIDDTGPGYLGVSVPDDWYVLTIGTVYYGAGTVSVITPVPDNIVPGPAYISYPDPGISDDFLVITPMAGTQYFAMITWTNVEPEELPAPEPAELPEEFDE